MTASGPTRTSSNVRFSVALGGKRTWIQRPGRDQNELTASNVTQRDDEKLERLTAPNPRPLFAQMIGNILISQCGNAHSRLVHKYPTRNPTPYP